MAGYAAPGQMPGQVTGQATGPLVGHAQGQSIAPHQQGAMPPPAQHLQQAAQMAAPAESKSLIGKLLKRAPKPVQQVQQMAEASPSLATVAAAPAAVKSSGSLLNKNFALGAVVGLLVGAFVLPQIVGLLGGKKGAVQAQAQSPAQVQAPALGQPLTQAEAKSLPGSDPNAPASEKGETFLDSAIKPATP